MCLKAAAITGPIRKNGKAAGPTGCEKRNRKPALSATIKVLLVERHEEARAAVAGYLASEPGLAVLRPCGNATEAAASAKEHAPDVALISVMQPDTDGFAAAGAIQTACPDARIIFVTTDASDELIARALEMRAHGILGREDSVSALPPAIREVMGGGTCFSEAIRARLIISPGGVLLAEPSQVSVAKTEDKR